MIMIWYHIYGTIVPVIFKQWDSNQKNTRHMAKDLYVMHGQYPKIYNKQDNVWHQGHDANRASAVLKHKD